MEFATRAAVEIRELHLFFQAWFNGSIPRNEDGFGRVRDVWRTPFKLVAPSNEVLSAEAILEMTFAQHAAFPHLAIRIENLVVHASGQAAVALYEEWHVDEHESEGRLCSATLVMDEKTAGGLRWLHLHESRISAGLTG